MPRKSDWPEDFVPNLNPREVIRAGVFGGSYFSRTDLIDVDEFPASWFAGVGAYRYASEESDRSVNLHGVIAGQSQEFWEEKGWMHEDDPRGWFQWYMRYWQGRRHEDDERQVDRWTKCAHPLYGRWTKRLFSMVHDAGTSVDDTSVSPKIRQTLLQWAYEPTQAHYDLWLESR